jgi:hypothetical protein
MADTSSEELGICAVDAASGRCARNLELAPSSTAKIGACELYELVDLLDEEALFASTTVLPDIGSRLLFGLPASHAATWSSLSGNDMFRYGCITSKRHAGTKSPDLSGESEGALCPD